MIRRSYSMKVQIIIISRLIKETLLQTAIIIIIIINNKTIIYKVQKTNQRKKIKKKKNPHQKIIQNFMNIEISWFFLY